MSGLQRKKHINYIIYAVLFFLSAVCIWLFCAWNEKKDNLIISRESGICEDGEEITAAIFHKGTIYYTLNGSEPQEYQEPLILSAREDGSWYEMGFFCVFSDGTQTPVQERTWFVTRSEEKPVTTDYIVSVWGEEEDLFSNESGIFVRGNQFDEYMKNHPDTDIYNTIIPANYFSDREIPVHSVIMSQSGKIVTDLNCGLKIYGNVTRAKNQKSFRLTARYRYDNENSFDYPFFPDLVNETGGEFLEYKRLSFHNSGNDNGYGFIRTEFCGELARQAGYPDVLVSKSAAVYINDRYMGVYWLQNTFGEGYFKEKYGDYNGEMIIIEGGMDQTAPSGDEEYRRAYAEEYNKFCSWLRNADIQDNTVWNRVENTIDVENFLQYMAIEYYINNSDWPKHNVKIFRYAAKEDDYKKDSVFDGRYRYLLFDMDYGMGLRFLDMYGKNVETESLAGLLDIQSSSVLFAKIMERKECRDSFINYVLNLRNVSFAPENAEAVLAALNASRWNELTYMMEKTNILKGSLWEADDNDITKVESELDRIRYFVNLRPIVVLNEMSSIWETGRAVTVRVSEEEKVKIKINGIQMNPLYHIVYYEDIPIEISAYINEGVKIKGYYLNDSYVEGSIIKILPGKYVKEDILTIRPEFEEEECECLHIAACRTSGNQDYVVLKNMGNVNVFLNQYYLSDDEDDLWKKQLPEETLKPGETVTFYGDKYILSENPVRYRLPFSWNKDEAVILSHHMAGIVEKVKNSVD